MSETDDSIALLVTLDETETRNFTETVTGRLCSGHRSGALIAPLSG